MKHQFLSILEVCDRTGLQRTKIYELFNDEDLPLPSMKLGRRRLVREDQLDEWMQKMSDRCSTTD